jgi:hypothetical protein
MPLADQTNSVDIEKSLNELLLAAKAHRTVWGVPVPWSAEPVFVSGFQVAPAFGAANQVIVCTYELPRGYSAVICGLVLGYVGAGGTALPGQVLYSVDVDNPSAIAVPNQQGYTEKDYGSVPFQLGALVGGPVWPVEFRHDQGEEIRIKAQTVSGVDVGAGTAVYGALIGFQWPSMGWER